MRAIAERSIRLDTLLPGAHAQAERARFLAEFPRCMRCGDTGVEECDTCHGTGADRFGVECGCGGRGWACDCGSRP